MNAKVESAKQKGKPIPQWGDEKEFLRDPSANPPIAWPMHLFDCCPISDGAACALLVAEELAESFTDTPLHVVGIGQGSGRGLHACEDLTSFEANRYAAKEAYAMSGLAPKDIQFSEVHDCFSIAEFVHIEDLGFFKPGQAYKAVEQGATGLDGPTPINTSGGLKAKGHPVGATGTGQTLRGVAAVPRPGGSTSGPQEGPALRGGAKSRRHRRYLHLHHSGEEVNRCSKHALTISPTSGFLAKKLMGCRCRSCGSRYVPPRPLCTKCYSAELEWVEYGGRVRLAAFTCIRIVPPTMQVWGYGRQNPYRSGVVELEEGGRVVAVIDEVEPTRPEEIMVGMPLTVKYLRQGEGELAQTMLAFKPT